MLILLALATLLAVVQNGVGIAIAHALGFSPLLAVMCSSVTLTGGPGTALGFASTFEAAGLQGAGAIGAAAATFGIVSASLLGGPVAMLCLRRVKPTESPRGFPVDIAETVDAPVATSATIATPVGSAFLANVRWLAQLGTPLVVHLLILLACIKIGAWLSLGLRSMGLTFPIYMGAMICGIVVRNALDLLGRPIVRTETVESLASVILAVFLAMAMTSLNLAELATTAKPMLIVLAAQILVMAAFAYYVTFNVMGRDYDAAVMAAGHVGFGLGVTPNAVANMNAIAARFGPAPRAFLVVTIVGAFLIDFTNAATITIFLNLLK